MYVCTGSISVSYHMTAPASRGLFRRVISLSGSAFVRDTPKNDIANSIKFVNSVGKLTHDIITRKLPNKTLADDAKIVNEAE